MFYAGYALLPSVLVTCFGNCRLVLACMARLLMKEEPSLGKNQAFPSPQGAGKTTLAALKVALKAFMSPPTPDIAVGAPFAGEDHTGRVFIYNGQSSGLKLRPSQMLEGGWASASTPPGFGFTLRGGSDLDRNDYPGEWCTFRKVPYPDPLRNSHSPSRL